MRFANVLDGAFAVFSEHAHQIVNLELFDDITILANITRFFDAPPGDVYAAGTIEGLDGSAVILVMHDGVIAGHITAPGVGLFDIRPVDASRVVIREIDLSQTSGRECGAIDAPPLSGTLVTNHPLFAPSGEGYPPTHVKHAHAQFDASPRGGFESICPLQATSLGGFVADDGSTVDLMVYYTAAAQAAAGGQSNIEAEIAAAVTYTNNAYLNSEITTSIRLIRTAPTSYIESPSAILNLDRLVNTTDGFLDEVHAERDEYGADLVSLWTDNILDLGGVAYQLFEQSPLDDGRFGFSVMREDNALFETLAHEIGHNFGVQHDRCNSSGIPFFDFGFGYRQPCPGPPPTPCSSPWPCTPNKDIMSYPPGMTVPYFSNPNILVAGVPIGGTDEHGQWCDVASAHNSTSFTVANFRPSTIISAPSARIHVDASAAEGGDGSSWSEPLRELQDAIGLAVQARGNITEIWVAAGTYYPDRGTGSRYASFRLANGVAIYGGFEGTETSLEQRSVQANPTILSGDIGEANDASDNSYHVVLADDRNATAVLDGFVIIGGNADGPYWPLFVGGGMISRCTTATIRNCVLIENQADWVGGAVFAEESAQVFEMCVFSHNSSIYGGAFELLNAAPEFQSSIFDSNTAEYLGGGVNSFASNPTFVSCDFIENRTLNEFGFFGAILATDESTLTVTDCSFSRNSSYVAGAIGIEGGSTAVVSGSTFTENSANYSGAVHINNAHAQFSDSVFESNQAGEESGDGYGGAMNISDDASVVILDCSFTSNTAGFGGGAIVSFGGMVSAARCRFIENEAWYGGGVWSDGGYSSYANCRLHGNIAQYGGGGVHASGGGDHAFHNSIFTGNSAPEGWGGAIFNFSGAHVTIDHCTIAGNAAPTGLGGGIHSDGNTSLLTHSIVWSNNAFNGYDESAQIAAFGDPEYILTYNNVQNWSGAFGGTANFGLDPMFVDLDGADNIIGTADDDIHLLPDSPCIEAGDPLYQPPIIASTDIDGEPRIMACRVDIGADEFTAGARNSGDLSENGTIDFDDIPLFVSVLLSGGAPTQICIADMNNDSDVDGMDLQPFVEALLAP